MKKRCYTILLLLWGIALFAGTTGEKLRKPAGFTENKGQFRDQHGNPNPEVLFSKDFGGMKVQLRRDGFSYELYQVKPKWVDPATIPYQIMTITEKGDTMITWPGKAESEKELMYHYHRVDVALEGGNPFPEIAAEQPLPEKERWLLGKNNPKILEISRFGQVRYTGVYPGIDLVCYANTESGGFKYDFVLQPGADPSLIRLRYSDAEKLSLTGEGNLEVVTRFGNLTESIPRCFSEDNDGKRVLVEGIHYQLADEAVKFSGAVVRKEVLVIDPAVNLVWGTYYGDSGTESISATAVDLAGFVYSCGNTSSALNIATSGTFLDSLLFPDDGFLVKITPQGQRSWGTYLSGFPARDIAIGNNSDIVINGENGILKFDTIGNLSWVLQENHVQTAVAINRQGDIVAIGDSIVTLSSSGINIWKIRFGGPETFLKDVVTDTAGNIIITGLTLDTTSVSTPGSFQPVYGGGSNKWGGYHAGYFTDSNGDAFLVKLSPEGNVIWSTYYGGNDYDEGSSVSVSENGKIVMAGRTNSLTGISTPGSFQSALTANGPIAFIVMGINFTWPCPDPDNMWMFLDTCLYGPYIPKPFDLRYQDHDCFLSWFDGDGNRISSTYYGDLYRDFSPKVACSQDKVYFGSTGFRRYNTSIKLSSDFSFLDHTGPGINNDYIFLACFDTICNRNWGTYYGDIQDISSLTSIHDGNLFVSDICKAPENSFIISGGCQNFEGISTPGTYKPLKSIDPNHPYHQLLGWDAFISNFSSTDAIIQPVSNISTCPGDSIALTYFDPLSLDSTLNYQWFKDSIPVPAGNNAILQLNPVSSIDQGYYHCVISSGDFYYILPRFNVMVADTIEFNLQQSGMSNSNPLFGDFNGDGYLDIIGANIYIRQDSAFVPAAYNDVQNPEQLSDIDGNGTIDILAGNRIFLNHIDSLQSIEVPATVTSWLDIDHDGDQDGIFYGSDSYSGKVFALINDELFFTLMIYNIINAPWGPISCTNGSIAADFNDDGETDLVVYGSGNSGCSSGIYCYYLERQADHFLFHNIGTLEIIRHFTVDASDWDSDGKTDLLFSGYDNNTPENNLLRVLKNDSGIFLTVFTDTIPGTTFNYSEVHGKWIDLDNDGDLDIIHGNDLILNNNGNFQKIKSTGNPLINTGLTNAACDAGDVNDDGYPEIISGSAFFTEISCSEPNVPPSAPEGLTSVITGDTVIFSWQPASDLQTPQMGLTYNLRVGTAPGGNNIMSSMSDSTGWRKVVGMGNVYQNTGWWLHNLPPGTYYWSVQAIDNSFAGGPFAPEQSFTIVPPVPVNTALAGDTITDGQTRCFDATNTITAGGNGSGYFVRNGGAVTLIAGQKISLLPTVSVEEYGKLHAWISTTGEYCFQAMPPMVQAKEAGETAGDQAQKPDDWQVKIYPNPTTGTICVKMPPDQPDTPVNITLRNLWGEKLLEKIFHGDPGPEISLENFPPGVYLIKVSQDEKSRILKIVLVR